MIWLVSLLLQRPTQFYYCVYRILFPCRLFATIPIFLELLFSKLLMCNHYSATGVGSQSNNIGAVAGSIISGLIVMSLVVMIIVIGVWQWKKR